MSFGDAAGFGDCDGIVTVRTDKVRRDPRRCFGDAEGFGDAGGFDWTLPRGRKVAKRG